MNNTNRSNREAKKRGGVLETARALLASDGLSLTDDGVARLREHADLVARWNDYASLVSRRDGAVLLERHTVDALSLAPWVRRLGGEKARLLDIGSGGGFPALPLKIVLPELRLTLVERSAKKVGVLRRMLVALEMAGVELIQGVFPGDAAGLAPDLLTARAVERPTVLWRGLADYLRAGQVFLCQTGDTSMADPAVFHVEHVEDDWTRRGLRRGVLDLIRRR